MWSRSYWWSIGHRHVAKFSFYLIWQTPQVNVMIKQHQDLLWHNVSTWSDTLPRPSVSPGRHTYQQCCICRDSQGSANCVLKTARNQLNYAWREYFYALLFEVFLSLNVCWPRPASIVHTTEATMRLCILLLHLLYGFVGLPVAFFVVEQGAVSDLAADWPFKSLLLLLFVANCQKL